MRFSLSEAELVSPEGRFQGEQTMIFDYSLAGLVSLGLLFYLTYALLRPEQF
jgi:K+-transporting ATPase KdpF subunit